MYFDVDTKPHIPYGRKPWPAHESLQEYAFRMGQSITAAYKAWHERCYDERSFEHYVVEIGKTVIMNDGPRGPGLGLTALDLRNLEIAR